MSDSDAGDDGFDKEAEREKLRKKYERDEKERQATRRMSDLLLKGATMTNTHCDACGDPLFRMNGTTFCPTCHGSPDAVEGTGLDAGGSEAADDGADDEREPNHETDSDEAASDAASSDEATGTSGASRAGPRGGGDRAGRPDADTATDRPLARSRDDSEPPRRDDPARSRSDAASSARSASSRRPDAPEREPRRNRPAPGRSSSDDLSGARDALVRALEKFADEAAATDDPRYARECLEAAREAGETLSTLR